MKKTMFFLFIGLTLLVSTAFSATETFRGKIVRLQSNIVERYPDGYTFLQLEDVKVVNDGSGNFCEAGDHGQGNLSYFGINAVQDSALLSLALAAFMAKKEIEIVIERTEKIGVSCKILNLALK